MSIKKERLATIRNLVIEHSLSNQEELLALLHQKGFVVTQATLSRDMKQLKIGKIHDNQGNQIYAIPERSGFVTQANSPIEHLNLAANGILSLEFSGQLGVIKTRPGYAMGIASDIDNKASREILGTIAGDDTILLIPREGIRREEIIEALAQINTL